MCKFDLENPLILAFSVREKNEKKNQDFFSKMQMWPMGPHRPGKITPCTNTSRCLVTKKKKNPFSNFFRKIFGPSKFSHFCPKSAFLPENGQKHPFLGKNADSGPK